MKKSLHRYKIHVQIVIKVINIKPQPNSFKHSILMFSSPIFNTSSWHILNLPQPLHLLVPSTLSNYLVLPTFTSGETPTISCSCCLEISETHLFLMAIFFRQTVVWGRLYGYYCRWRNILYIRKGSGIHLYLFQTCIHCDCVW